MDLVKEIKELVAGKKTVFLDAADKIWEYAEIGFRETKSAETLIAALKADGFTVDEGVAGIPTAFVASYGSGSPIIGLLGEYDALPALKHKASDAIASDEISNDNGHGCGHNLLGAGSLGAALAVKEYLAKHKMDGTIKYYGCPGEEFGSGKMFMARDGIFDELDAAFTWHGGNYTSVTTQNTQANLCAYFKFRGKTAHAAGAPHLGRSALDACELMNVGCNYLREHMMPDERIHYAYTDVGGTAPNVVQDHACVFYYVRSPRLVEVQELYERVKEVARGAAMMTGTTLEVVLNDGLCEYIPNHVLSTLLYDSLKKVGAPQFDGEDIALAESFAKTFEQSAYDDAKRKMSMLFGAEIGEKYHNSLLVGDVLPYIPNSIITGGSTDVGDVSYCTPTAQANVACWALGTSGHTWQITAQSCSSIAHKGTVTAAEALALTAIEAMNNPELLRQAKTEFTNVTGGKYICPVPADVMPTL